MGNKIVVRGHTDCFGLCLNGKSSKQFPGTVLVYFQNYIYIWFIVCLPILPAKVLAGWRESLQQKQDEQDNFKVMAAGSRIRR